MTKPTSVMIWRYNDYGITVCRNDNSAYNALDTEFRREWQHEGIWNSEQMRFIPSPSHFSDGVPVDDYQGLEPEEQWES